jgi:hypothetical protein
MRLATLAALAALGLPACDDPTVPTGADPELQAVNGARQPVVDSGQVTGWAGVGFGAEPGSNVLLVTTAAGLTPLAPSQWSDLGILARLPPDIASGPTYVVTAADTLGPIPLLVRPPVSFTPGARVWAEGAALPEPLAGLAGAGLAYPGSAGIDALAVLFGGLRTDGTISSTTYIGQVDQDGRIVAWAAAPDTVVPPARHDHAMAAADPTNSRIDRRNGVGDAEGVAYLIGGRDAANSILPSVHGLAVSASGAYGLWSALTPLPGARAGAAAIVVFGNLIVMGGYGPDSLASRRVSVASIAADGTLNGWFEGPALPEGRAYAAAAVSGQTLFLVGGELGLVDPAGVTDTAAVTGTVFAIRLSPRTGSFQDSAWTTAGTLLHPRSRHGAWVLDDALVAAGGVYAGMPGAGESEYAPVTTDGALGTFAESPPPTMAELAGAPAWSTGLPTLMTRVGTRRATPLGGATPAGPSSRIWSQ